MKKTVLLLLLALLIVFITGNTLGETVITVKEQLNQPGMKVAVSTGSASMLIAEKEFPQAEIVYYEENTIAYEAVAQGKVDAYVFDRDQMQKAITAGGKVSGCWVKTWMKASASPSAFPRSQAFRILNHVLIHSLRK